VNVFRASGPKVQVFKEQPCTTLSHAFIRRSALLRALRQRGGVICERLTANLSRALIQGFTYENFSAGSEVVPFQDNNGLELSGIDGLISVGSVDISRIGPHVRVRAATSLTVRR